MEKDGDAYSPYDPPPLTGTADEPDFVPGQVVPYDPVRLQRIEETRLADEEARRKAEEEETNAARKRVIDRERHDLVVTLDNQLLSADHASADEVVLMPMYGLTEGDYFAMLISVAHDYVDQGWTVSVDPRPVGSPGRVRGAQYVWTVAVRSPDAAREEAHRRIRAFIIQTLCVAGWAALSAASAAFFVWWSAGWIAFWMRTVLFLVSYVPSLVKFTLAVWTLVCEARGLRHTVMFPPGPSVRDAPPDPAAPAVLGGDGPDPFSI